jgi:hypothetical protein
MPAHKNRVQCTSTTSGTGTLTLGAASSGYQTLTAAYGADATVDILITEGTAWEVARNCAFTHGANTVTRGTLEASSTGSALNLAGTGATVSVINTAAAGQAVHLNHIAGTDADVTMVVNSMYVVDMSAWATADRNYTLPATAAVGDRVGILVTAGDASHELIIKPNTGDTLIGGATSVTAAEWSRIFITGECVIMRCVTASADWVVEYDGRIPQVGNMRLSASADTESAATFTRPTQASSAGTWTADVDIGSICSTTGDQIKTRRAGYFNLSYVFVTKDAPLDQAAHGASLHHNGTTNILHYAPMYASSSASHNSGAVILGYQMAVDDYVVYLYRTAAGSLGALSSSLPRIICGFSLVEVL